MWPSGDHQEKGCPYTYDPNWSGVVPASKRECTDNFFVVLFLMFHCFLLTSGITARYRYGVLNPFGQTESKHNNRLVVDLPNTSFENGSLINYTVQVLNSNETQTTDTNQSIHSNQTLITHTLTAALMSQPITSSVNSGSQTNVTGAILTMIGTAVVLTVLTILSLRYFTKIMVYGSFGIWCIILLVSTLYSFAKEAILTGSFSFLMLFVLGFYLISFRHQIPFSIGFLRCAVIALSENLSLTLLVYPLLTILGLTCYAITLYSWTPIFMTGDAPTTLVILAIFGVFMSFWTYEAFQSLATVTVSYSIGQWYVCRRSQTYKEPNQVLRAFIGLTIGLTYHSGTILFGSMLIAIVSTLRFLARWAQREIEGNDWFGMALRLIGYCAECLLGCLEGLLQYINRYAMIYTGLHGHKFSESSRKVWQLFLRADCQNFINDIVVGILVQAITFLIVGLVLMTGLAVSWTTGNSFLNLPGPLITVLILATLLYAFGRLVIVTVDTLLVCYVEDLERNGLSGRINCPDELKTVLEEYEHLPSRLSTSRGNLRSHA